MPNFNQVIVVGNLTRDVELRHTRTGTPVTDISLAVNEKRKDSGGNIVEETTFIDITLWNKLAEIAHKHLRKGDVVFVQGRLKLETWKTEEGQKRSKLKVIARRMQRISYPKNE